MEGLVVKALNVWYHVHTGEGVVVCRPRGRFKARSAQASPAHGEPAVLVGDRVRCRVLSDGTGAIEEVQPRRSRLLRPPIANADQVLVVFTLQDPTLNLDLVDRILVSVDREGLKAVPIINKVDLLTAAGRDQADEIANTYRVAGYECLLVSAFTGAGLDAVTRLVPEKITVVAGQSGVGKSCLINSLVPGIALRIGEVGRQAGRGRHTTTHVELLRVPPRDDSPDAAQGWIADTPGFSRLHVNEIAPAELSGYFPEMAARAGDCRFRGCLHEEEPDCVVKAALDRGDIDRGRYNRYRRFLDEIKSSNRHGR